MCLTALIENKRKKELPKNSFKKVASNSILFKETGLVDCIKCNKRMEERKMYYHKCKKETK